MRPLFQARAFGKLVLSEWRRKGLATALQLEVFLNDIIKKEKPEFKWIYNLSQALCSSWLPYASQIIYIIDPI
jgi:hypothetical protein